MHCDLAHAHSTAPKTAAELRRALDRLTEMEAERSARLLDFERDRLRRAVELNTKLEVRRKQEAEAAEAARKRLLFAGRLAALCALAIAGPTWPAAALALAAILAHAFLVARDRRSRARRLDDYAADLIREWDELERSHHETVGVFAAVADGQLSRLGGRWNTVLTHVRRCRERFEVEKQKLDAARLAPGLVVVTG